VSACVFFALCVIVFTRFASGLDAKLDTVLALQQEQAQRLERVEHLVAAVNPDDPWEAMSQVTTHSSSQTLRRNLKKLYGDDTCCFLTGAKHNSSLPQDEQVVAAHIWPGCRRDSFVGEIDGACNGLLLLRPVEIAFDKRQVIFLCNPFDKSIVFRVLDPGLNDISVYETTTFNKLDNKVVRCDGQKRPSFKLLSRHANSAVNLARTNQWIDDSLAKEMLDQITLASPETSRDMTPPLELDSVHRDFNEDGAGAVAGAGGKSKKRNKKSSRHSVSC
jgi:hypothetical protein